MKKLLLAIIMIVFTGCFDSGKPSDSEIKTQALTQIVTKQSGKIYSIENFKKTNGFEKDEKTYIADIQYDIVFKKSLRDIEKEFGSFASMALSIKYGNFKAGHRATNKQKATLIKKENGWVLSNIKD